MKRFLTAFAVLFLLVCVIGTSGAAAEAGESAALKPVADEMIGSGGITWVPKVNFGQLALTVSRPDGTVIKKTFDSGSTPYLDLSGIYGDSSCDGSYTYELRVIPAAAREIRKTMETAGLEKKGILPQKSLTQTGHFRVKDGALVTNTTPEGIDRTSDVLHYDDVIITGSLCVGFDCADGESFGFDTIILKEHNLRIYFNDTSYTASYPTNSWRITINDSTNGGASYFSVDDVDDGTSIFKIEAGAPSNSLYVEDYGRVGLGTSTPVVELHIKDSDTPTLRLEQDSSGGWTAQTWDVAGNESNFFVRDATNGSKLPFRIQPSTPSSTLCLKSDGYVGIGTWSPAEPMELETTGEDARFIAERTSGATALVSGSTDYAFFGAITSHPMRFVSDGNWRMQLNTDNSLDMASGAECDSTGHWNDASSREYKENIKNLTVGEAIDTLKGLEPVKFNYKTDKSKEYAGFIAEDVPELVATKSRKTLGSLDIIAVLTKVVQQQQAFIREQKKINSQLKQTIAELKKK